MLKLAFFTIDAERSNGVLSKFFFESLDKAVQHVAASVDFSTFAVIVFLIMDYPNAQSLVIPQFGEEFLQGGLLVFRVNIFGLEIIEVELEFLKRCFPLL